MKNFRNQAVIRLGDRTSHAGEVVSASGLPVQGQAAALQGDRVYCPRCLGYYEIQVRSGSVRQAGKLIAHEGDEAVCGAILISSLP